MSEPFLAEIRTVGFNFPPRGWAFCDGQLLPIAQYSAVFSLVGTTFGGDGRTTFGLPDLRGRNAVHPGTGAGVNRVTWGQRSGSNNKTLAVANLPAHNHAVKPAVNSGNANDGDETSPVNTFPGGAASDRFYEATNGNGGAYDTENSGSSQPFDVTNPFLGVYHIFALTGLFPSRS